MAEIQLDDVPESERQYEIIDGKKVWMPLRSVRSMALASDLAFNMGIFTDKMRIGKVNCHMLHSLPVPGDRNRRPSLSYVSFQRWPEHKPLSRTAEAWDVVPEIAVEVLGPNDLTETVAEKLNEFLSSGVLFVAIVYPLHRVTWVFDTSRTGKAIAFDEPLRFEPILPDLQVRLSDLMGEADSCVMRDAQGNVEPAAP